MHCTANVRGLALMKGGGPMNEYMELLDKPYLKSNEIAKLLDTSPATVTNMVKQQGLKKWPWGYSTDELIKKLGLQPYINRQKKKAPPADQSKSAQ